MEIIVRGRSGSGKSAVAQHIAQVLRAAGFEVTHDPEYFRTPDEQAGVLSHVARAGLRVTITEEQAASASK